MNIPLLDLRHHRPEMELEIGKEYLSLVSDGWNNGHGGITCWHVYTKVTGYNGGGGYWVEQRWAWSSGGTHHTDILSLSYEQSRELERKIMALYQPKPQPSTDTAGGAE